VVLGISAKGTLLVRFFRVQIFFGRKFSKLKSLMPDFFAAKFFLVRKIFGKKIFAGFLFSGKKFSMKISGPEFFLGFWSSAY